ncbi:MFS transporter [Kitasatospora sp. NPDC052896]|uniref:MFS transporter n=1 Tax=Kitasatospora sp. NPDC052896 TaxID=3364061 RepID=UPI0037CBCCD0
MKKEPVSRDFTLLWSGKAISDAGSAVTQFALPLVGVIYLHASPLQAGLLTSCSSVASALLAIPAGAALDAMKKRPVMVASDLARMVLLGSLPLAQALGQLTLVQLYVVAVLCGLFTMLFNVSSQAHLPALISSDQLLRANSQLGSTSWIANIGGPMFGGVLVAALGAARAILLDVGSFLASVVTVCLLKTPEPETERRKARNFRNEISAGISFLLKHRQLRRLTLSNAFTSWSLMFLTPLEVIFLIRELGATAEQWGLINGLACVGGLVGVSCIGWLSRYMGTGQRLWWFGLSRGWGMAIVVFAQRGLVGLAAACIGWFILLFSASIYNTTQQTLRQQICPANMRARVHTAVLSLTGAGKVLAPLLGGIAAETFGLRAALAIGTFFLCVAPLVLDRSEQESGTRLTAEAPAATAN